MEKSYNYVAKDYRISFNIDGKEFNFETEDRIINGLLCRGSWHLA